MGFLTLRKENLEDFQREIAVGALGEQGCFFILNSAVRRQVYNGELKVGWPETKASSWSGPYRNASSVPHNAFLKVTALLGISDLHGLIRQDLVCHYKEKSGLRKQFAENS